MRPGATLGASKHLNKIYSYENMYRGMERPLQLRAQRRDIIGSSTPYR